MSSEHRPPNQPKGSGLPDLHTPEAVGKLLGRSGWWVRDQCRRGRFPHTRAAGSIRFTGEQFAEVLRILERRPSGESSEQQARPSSRQARSQAVETPVVQLRARPPRSRTRKASPPEGNHTA